MFENNLARVQVSVPLEKVGLRGRFLNGELQVRPAPDGNPRNLEVTEVSLGGVSDKILPEKKTDQPVGGLLYFPMEKQKLKQLEIRYGPLESRITLRFK